MPNRIKVLFICNNKHFKRNKKRIHHWWVRDCINIFDIKVWGNNFGIDISKKSLLKTISQFKPDYIYATHHRTVYGWLPDLTDIDIPKIFVEVDSYKYDANDPWYKQFTKVYNRQPGWNHVYTPIYDNSFFYNKTKKHNKLDNHGWSKKEIKKIASKEYSHYLKCINFAKTWNKIPIFRYSVPDDYPVITSINRESKIRFVGKMDPSLYPICELLSEKLKEKVEFYSVWDKQKYIDCLRSASVLVCPTESLYGDFIPCKLMEYLSSGTPVLTNCNLSKYSPELEPYIIRYKDLDDLKNKLSLDFTSYYNKIIPIMKKHIHSIRYKEIFK